MNLLLDTHALLWWLNDDPTLKSEARDAIANPKNTVFVSAVVVMEIRIKQAIGKLSLPEGFREILDAQAFSSLPITMDHAHAVARLPSVHRDPFDRLLIAQASEELMKIATRDAVFAHYEIDLIAA